MFQFWLLKTLADVAEERQAIAQATVPFIKLALFNVQVIIAVSVTNIKH